MLHLGAQPWKPLLPQLGWPCPSPHGAIRNLGRGRDQSHRGLDREKPLPEATWDMCSPLLTPGHSGPPSINTDSPPTHTHQTPRQPSGMWKDASSGNMCFYVASVEERDSSTAQRGPERAPHALCTTVRGILYPVGTPVCPVSPQRARRAGRNKGRLGCISCMKEADSVGAGGGEEAHSELQCQHSDPALPQSQSALGP